MLTPTQKQTAQSIVNLFETGSVLGDYGSVTVIAGDTGHLTFGRSQTTLPSGNLLNLMEPGHASAFLPWMIDNEKFPPSWRITATDCAANCRHCGKCAEVLRQVLVKTDED